MVRGIAQALAEAAGNDWEVRFVAADRRQAYHVIDWPGTGGLVEPSAVVARPGDVFFGLDFSLDTVRRYRRQLARFRRDGGSLWFLICDLLPAERPEWFSPNNVLRYKVWLEILAGIADGFFCISQQTQDDLERVLDARHGLAEGYRTAIVPMGYSIQEAMLVAADERPDAAMRFDASSPFSLMVGTLEPRKGHADILAGFSELWRRGSDERLVLVGRTGWKIDDLRAAIRSHPEHGHKLMWFDDVEDVELECIYQACQGVIIGSHAEGFGLPLIEALGHNKPVLARDLPVFRAHQELGVCYFPADAGPQVLAQSIEGWTQDVQAGRITVTSPTVGWKQAGHMILSAIS